MSTSEVLAIIEEAIEAKRGSLRGDESINDLEGWDSIAVLSLITLVDERFGTVLSPQAISEARTVKDLVAMVEG